MTSNPFPQLTNMNDIEITESGVKSLLANLNPHSAHGPDGISNQVLKRCAARIAPFLVVLFTLSLNCGTFFRDWKIPNITPLHKSGDKDKPCNYRPVSLTSVCCKTLEHIIYSCLIKHLQDNKFFTPWQHGFRSGLSCVTQLTEFIHDIASGFDKGVQVDAIFLLSKSV